MCGPLHCAVLCCSAVRSFLGLSVGAVQSNISVEAAQAAYSCHVTYVTGQELCFTYLKDNTAQSAAELVRGNGFHQAQGCSLCTSHLWCLAYVTGQQVCGTCLMDSSMLLDGQH